jgi:hypothetical protein
MPPRISSGACALEANQTPVGMGRVQEGCAVLEKIEWQLTACEFRIEPAKERWDFLTWLGAVGFIAGWSLIIWVAVHGLPFAGLPCSCSQ